MKNHGRRYDSIIGVGGDDEYAAEGGGEPDGGGGCDGEIEGRGLFVVVDGEGGERSSNADDDGTGDRDVVPSRRPLRAATVCLLCFAGGVVAASRGIRRGRRARPNAVPPRPVVPLSSAPPASFPWRFVDGGEGEGGLGPHFLGHLEFCGSSGAYGYRVPGGGGDDDGPVAECGAGPPPVIRVRPLEEYRLVLINGSDRHTNLHVHGLHAPGQGAGSDDVTRRIPPGGCLAYRLSVRSSRDVGTFWYHAHLHPEAAVQVGGGGHGMMIVDYAGAGHLRENFGERVVPRHLEAFLLDRGREVLLQFFTAYDKRANVRSTRVNGLRIASLRLLANDYYYVRISAVSMTDKQNYVQFDPPEACVVRVVAYDGIYRSKVPHERPSHIHFVSSSSRLDLAVKCSQNATISYRNETNYGDNHHAQSPTPMVSPLVEIQVREGEASSEQASFASPFWDPNLETQWEPPRPYYLEFNKSTDSERNRASDGNGTDVGEPWVVELKSTARGDGLPKLRTIGGASWDDARDDGGPPVRRLPLGGVASWTLRGTHKHPFHAHVDAMRIATPGGCGRRYEAGEFYDTISASCRGPEAEYEGGDCEDGNGDADDDCDVELFLSDFAGRMILHCHRFSHEDGGMMTWVDIENGTGHDVQDFQDVECSSTGSGP